MPDTPDEGIQDESGDGDGGFVLGTYKSIEEAKKGFEEKESLIRRLQSEKDKAKAEGSKLTDILEKLTEATTAKQEPKEDPQAQIEAFVEKAASALEDDPKQGIRMILEAVSGWQGQSEKQQSEARETAVKEIAAQLGQSVAEVKRTLAERDPDVMAYGAAAKKLAEDAGIEFEANRETLIRIAKATAKTDQPPRHELPGGSETTRVVGREPAEPLTAEMKKLVGWDKLNDRQKAELKRKWGME